MKGKKLQQIKWTEEGLLGFKYRENVSLEMRASHHFPGSAFRAYLWEAESERVRVRGPSALSHVTKPSLPQRLCYLLLLLTRPLATAPRPGYEGLRPLNFIPYKRNPPLTHLLFLLPPAPGWPSARHLILTEPSWRQVTATVTGSPAGRSWGRSTGLAGMRRKWRGRVEGVCRIIYVGFKRLRICTQGYMKLTEWEVGS